VGELHPIQRVKDAVLEVGDLVTDQLPEK
jgi:hypothetical protein